MLRLTAVCLASLALLALPQVAWADVLHLTNGRTVEGQVVEQTAERIVVVVPNGRLTMPRSMVKKIEAKRTPQELFAHYRRRMDMSDPAQVRRLANWSSRKGLGEEAKQLRSQAKGLELDRRVARARASGQAADYVALYRWSKRERYSSEVQEWLLEQAIELDPLSAAVTNLLDEREAEAQRQAALLARKEAEAAAARAAAERAQARERREELAARNAKIKRLEDDLAAQRKQLADLSQVTEQNRRRRWRRNRRGRGVGVIVVGGIPVQPVQPIQPQPARPAFPAPPPPRPRGVFGGR